MYSLSAWTLNGILAKFFFFYSKDFAFFSTCTQVHLACSPIRTFYYFLVIFNDIQRYIIALLAMALCQSWTCLRSWLLVMELNVVVSFLGVVGGVSKNYLTIGHLTFREASSTFFCSSLPIFRPHMHANYPVWTFSLHQKKCKFYLLPCSTSKSVEQLMYFFYTLEHMSCFLFMCKMHVMFLNYVYYLCI